MSVSQDHAIFRRSVVGRVQGDENSAGTGADRRETAVSTRGAALRHSPCHELLLVYIQARGDNVMAGWSRT
jgi:hypothetical protein